jgi:hypothetical protein
VIGLRATNFLGVLLIGGLGPSEFSKNFQASRWDKRLRREQRDERSKDVFDHRL